MASPQYLVDVNLPKFFRYFNNEHFVHVVDLNPQMSDTMLWKYAMKHDLIILTKDADFYFMALINEDCPKVVYFQLGNHTIRQLHNYFELHWESIVKQLEMATFIIAKPSKIEIVFK